MYVLCVDSIFITHHSNILFFQLIVEPDTSDDEVKRYLRAATYYDDRKSIEVPNFNYRIVDRRKSAKYFSTFILVDPSRFLKRLKDSLASSTYELLYDGFESSEKLLSIWEEWFMHVLRLISVVSVSSPSTSQTSSEADSLKEFEMSRHS